MPKAGDRTHARNRQGRLTAYIWVVCPGCNNGRWAYETNTKRVTFTGKCKACYLKAAKKDYYNALHFY